MNLYGVRIVTSESACEYVRVKSYARRRARSTAHWLRIDKKWRKRYGMLLAPRCYQVGDLIFVHPLLMPEIRRLTQEAL